MIRRVDRPDPAVSRRAILAATAAMMSAMVPGVACAQPSASQLGDGFRILRAAPGRAALPGAGQGLPIWGFDGLIPGPTLRANRGEEVKVRLVNELDEPISVHWHGMRIANAMDGVTGLTQPAIAPGQSFDYRFAAADAGTFWYHAGATAPHQAGRGLYGALIVDEVEPVDVDRDVTLVVGEWPPAAGASMADATAASTRSGGERPRLTINGLASLDVPVKSNERIRLRVVNAAGARVLAFRLNRHRAIVMAIDGEPAEPFEARDSRFALGPGNRIDLFFDATLEPGATALLAVDDGGDNELVRLVYESGTPARAMPRAQWQALPANPLPERMDFVQALKFDIALDGQNAAPLFAVQRGRTVMLGLVNHTASAYVTHVHGHHFRLLDRLDDGWKPFWLDTLVVPPGQTFRIAFVADNPGKWLLAVNPLEPAAAPPGWWFEVQ